ncbi:esterase [Herminiimonas fonticola]|uniref:alpha/beta hydrolase n=1 Tax=Herminiimonas fonticola TaxID=303380 RepID=UPI00333E31D1
MIDPSLMGRLSFAHTQPTKPPLQPGRHSLGIAEERDTFLYVPNGLEEEVAVPLMVLFHGGGGSAEKVAHFLEQHAEQNQFLLMVPQSIYPTWDIVIGGNGPDLHRLNTALAKVAEHYFIDPDRFCFAGFSDGGSYAMSIGLTNGDLVTHVVVFSGGFMSVFMQEGAPHIFITHGLSDEQLPIETSGRPNAQKMKAAGYDVTYLEFNGNHSIQPPIVDLAVKFFLTKPANR